MGLLERNAAVCVLAYLEDHKYPFLYPDPSVCFPGLLLVISQVRKKRFLHGAFWAPYIIYSSTLVPVSATKQVAGRAMMSQLIPEGVIGWVCGSTQFHYNVEVQAHSIVRVCIGELRCPWGIQGLLQIQGLIQLEYKTKLWACQSLSHVHWWRYLTRTASINPHYLLLLYQANYKSIFCGTLWEYSNMASLYGEWFFRTGTRE